MEKQAFIKAVEHCANNAIPVQATVELDGGFVLDFARMGDCTNVGTWLEGAGFPVKVNDNAFYARLS